MDGRTLVEEIRKRAPNVPILMITSEFERERVVDAIKTGVNDYLIKPFSPVGLREKLSNLLARIAD